jgi:hypothetical protein
LISDITFANSNYLTGYLDCVVDLYNCTATFASCRAVFKTCQQNLPELPLGRSGATVAASGGLGGTDSVSTSVVSAVAGSGAAAGSNRGTGLREDGTPSLADGAGKVPESKY